MPDLTIYRDLRDAAFFLYPSEQDARSGAKFGGTGFGVAVPTRFKDRFLIYAVTNWHVACKAGCSVIRLNRLDDGPADVFSLGPEDWHFVPGGNDVAVALLPWKLDVHRVKALRLDMFADQRPANSNPIGAGDNVFMVGRFMNYDGVETNEPALRFGHVSIVSAKIRQPTGSESPSVVLDMHSRSGFSGSPVFAYRATGDVFLKPYKGPSDWEMPAGHMMLALGIVWGHFPEEWELRNIEKGLRPNGGDGSLITDGAYVQGFSGMACAVPGQAIADLLNSPKILAQRMAIETAIEIAGTGGERLADEA